MGNTYRPKKTESKKSAITFKGISFSFLKDERFRLAFGLFLMVFAFAILIAFISYLFNGFEDQSILEELGDVGVSESGRQVSNWLGITGAWLAHIFMYKWFGIASFLFVPIFFLAGYKIVNQKELPFYKGMVKSFLFFIFWTSVALGYLAYYSDSGSFLLLICGGVGFEIAAYADSLTGFGTILFLLFILVVFSIYFFDIKSLNFASNKKGEFTEEEEENEREDSDLISTDFEEDETEEQDTEEGSLEFEVKEEESISEKNVKSETEAQNQVEFETEVSKPAPKVKPEPDLSLEIEQPEPREEIVEEENGVNFEIEEKVDIDENVEELEHYDPTLDLATYKYPTLDLLENHVSDKIQVTREELEANKDRIIETLGNYKIGISSIKATIGPTVTMYEIVPEAGVKISKIKNLEDDIALSLAALGIRIIAPIPGKGAIGIEVPNKSRELVSMRSVIATEAFQKTDKTLPVVLGRTISNEAFVIDLAKLPHLLIAGATGQGKSVGINVLLTSLLYKKHPSQLKFVLIDPKKVELAVYSEIERHFLAKLPDEEEAIITDTKKVVNTLNSLCIEMDTRYDLLKDAGCRNIKEYNGKFIKRKLNPKNGHRYLPYIVVVIDELADLMMTAGKEVETPIARLAQLARAIGIHLVVATQRPSVNVITGIIKANFPARLSFRVTSKIDSRTILDTGGAEQLVGMGDMLLSLGSDLTRVQCAFIDTPEVDALCEFIGSQRGYSTALHLPEYVDESAESGSTSVDLKDRDVMFDDAARVIVGHQQGSTSLLQRKMKLGYNRAGRIIDQLEAAGVVGPFEGSKAREVLIPDEYSLELLLTEIKSKN